MYRKNKKINSHGFTLIEIIASITIIGIVIAVLLPIFPQIMSWTNNTEDELVASNLLEQVAHDIKNDDALLNQSIENCSERNATSITDYDTKKPNNTMYNVALNLCQSDDEEAINLIRAKILISTDGNQISESYTYINAGDAVD